MIDAVATIATDQLLNGVASRLIFEGSACDTYPCWNEGECIQSNVSKRAYSCRCDGRFVGNHCQFRVTNLCASGKCQPGSNCTVSGLQIACPTDYVADFLSSCANTACLNGGECAETGAGHRCYCRPPWTGPYCQFNSDDVSHGWNVIEAGLLLLLFILVVTSFIVVCCSGNGFYMSVPTKRYSRWEEGDISDDEDREIALNEMKKGGGSGGGGSLRVSHTTETMMEPEQASTSGSSHYGVVDL